MNMRLNFEVDPITLADQFADCDGRYQAIFLMYLVKKLDEKWGEHDSDKQCLFISDELVGNYNSLNKTRFVKWFESLLEKLK